MTECQPHWTLKPDPDLKGSYYRRIEDIDCAFKKMDADNLPTAAKFLVCYFGCEKLAQGIVGVYERCPAKQVYRKGQHPNLCRIKPAVAGLKLNFPVGDLGHLFERRGSSSEKPLQDPTAMDLRDAMVHNFGPTTVDWIHKKADVLLPMMDRFLQCRRQVLEHLEKRWPAAYWIKVSGEQRWAFRPPEEPAPSAAPGPRP